MKRKSEASESSSKKRKNDLSSDSETIKIIFDNGDTFQANRDWLEGYEYFDNLLSTSKTNSIKIPNRDSNYFQFILNYLDCCLFYELIAEEEDIDEFKEEAKFYDLQNLFDNLLDLQFSKMEFKEEQKLSGTVSLTSIAPENKIASGILDFTISPTQVNYGSDQYRYYFEFEVIGNLAGFHIGFVSETNIKDSIMYGCQTQFKNGVFSVWYDFKGNKFVVYVDRKFCSEKPLGEWKSKSCQPIIGVTFANNKGVVKYRRNATHPRAPKRDNIFTDLDADDFDC